MIVDQFQSNYVIENFSDRIKVTIQGQKKWGWFLMLLFTFVFNGLCFFPLFVYITVSFTQKYLNYILLTIIVGILMVILYIFTMRRKFFELMDYAFDKEIIEVMEHQIKVERMGFLRFRTVKYISAKNIKGITGSFANGGQFNFLNSIPFMSSTPGSVLIWKRKSHFLPFHFYGKELSQSDAQLVIDAILRKYPKYRYTDVIR